MPLGSMARDRFFFVVSLVWLVGAALLVVYD